MSILAEPPTNRLVNAGLIVECPQLAVALKNGLGSRDFNADVNAFVRDHIVREANS